MGFLTFDALKNRTHHIPGQPLTTSPTKPKTKADHVLKNPNSKKKQGTPTKTILKNKTSSLLAFFPSHRLKKIAKEGAAFLGGGLCGLVVGVFVVCWVSLWGRMDFKGVWCVLGNVGVLKRF